MNCYALGSVFFFSSRRRHTRYWRDWSSDVCSSDLVPRHRIFGAEQLGPEYSMAWNSLDSGLQLFFSRAVQGKAGEDLRSEERRVGKECRARGATGDRERNAEPS